MQWQVCSDHLPEILIVFKFIDVEFRESVSDAERKISLSNVRRRIHACKDSEVRMFDNWFSIYFVRHDDGFVAGFQDCRQTLEGLVFSQIDLIQEDPLTTLHSMDKRSFDESKGHDTFLVFLD